jgi:HK97 family phage prohead protease
MERMSIGLGEFKFAESGDAMTLSGYGAVFGNVDAYGDVIAPGAFAKSLAQHKAEGTTPQMLLEHGASPLPIGVWKSMSEDGHGLKVEGEFLTTSLAIDAWKAAKAGAISGLSIGYRPTEFELRAKADDPRRTLKSVDLIEVSLVGRPANSKARVGQVKSAEEIITIRELEDALRDAGYSKSDALAICARFQAKADRGEPETEEAFTLAAEGLLQSLKI